MTVGPSITAVVGDITLMETDAIVSPANTALTMTEGIARAISQAGGDVVGHEAAARGPIRLGDAVATGAGNLPAKFVIHAAVVGDNHGKVVPPTRDTISQATTAALAEANRLRLESVAFPALGGGLSSIDIADVAEVMVEAVTSHVSHPDTHVHKVVFVLGNENARLTFAEAIDQGGFVP